MSESGRFGMAEVWPQVVYDATGTQNEGVDAAGAEGAGAATYKVERLPQPISVKVQDMEGELTGKVIASGETYSIYVMVAPGKFPEGSYLPVTVRTDKGEFYKDYPQHGLVLKAGTHNTGLVKVNALEVITPIEITDPVLKEELLAKPGIDQNGDGIVSVEEAAAVDRITFDKADYADLSFVKEFPNLTYLMFTEDLSTATSLDLSGMEKLETVYLPRMGEMTTIDLSDCSSLKTFQFVSCSKLTSLKLPTNSKVESLGLTSYPLKSIDLSTQKELKDLRMPFCKLEGPLDLTANKKLEILQIMNSRKITSVNVSGLDKLQSFSFPSMNPSALESVNVQGCTSLQSLVLQNSKLVSLDLTGLVALEELDASKPHSLKTLNTTNCPNLKKVDISEAWMLPAVDFSGKSKLQSLNCSGMKNSSVSGLTVNVKGCSSLNNLLCRGNRGLLTLDVSECSHELGTADKKQLNLEGCDELTEVHVWSSFFTEPHDFCTPLSTSDIYIHVTVGN